MAYRVEESSLVAVADAIRLKSGFAVNFRFPEGFVGAINDINAIQTSFVELTNSSSANARMYISKSSEVKSEHHDLGAGGVGSAYSFIGSMVVVRCGADCTATATSGCSWVMNVTGTSYRVFAFLVTEATAKIKVTNA